MLQGAISLTDDSIYLRENFADLDDIAFYSLKHLEALPHTAHMLLTDTAQSERIRKNAYQKAKEQHTWKNRLQELFS